MRCLNGFAHIPNLGITKTNLTKMENISESKIEGIIHDTFKECITGECLAYIAFTDTLPKNLDCISIMVKNFSFGLGETFLDVSFTLVKDLWKSERTYRWSQKSIIRI